MPRLPTPEDYGSVTPRATRGMARVEADPLGRTLVGISSDLSRMAEEETRKLEDLSVQNMLNELETVDMELTYGDNGYTKTQGQRVLDTPLLKTMPETYTQKITALGAKLTTPRAKAVFETHAGKQKAQFVSRLMHHVAVQSEKAFGQTWEATKARLVTRAVAEPEMLDAHLAKADELITSRMSHDGLKPDSEEAKLLVDTVRGDLVMPAIQKALSGDDAVTARALFNEYKKYLGAKADDFETAVVRLEAETAAVPLAQKALAAYRGGAKSTDVEKMIQDDAGASKVLRDTAQSEYSRLRTAYALDMQDQQGALHLEFMNSPDAATARKIQRSEAFLALPKHLQEQTAGYLRQQVEHQASLERSLRAEGRAMRAEARAEARMAEADKATDPTKYLRYLEIATSPGFAALSPNQIGAYLPELGRDHVNSLQALRKDLLARGQAYKISSPTVQAAVAGLDKDKPLALGLIEANLDAWKARNPGQLPSPEVETAIIGNALMDFSQKMKLGYSMDIPVYQLPRSPSAAAKVGDKWYVVPRGAQPPLAVHVSVPLEVASEVLRRYPNATAEQIKRVWEAQQQKKAKR